MKKGNRKRILPLAMVMSLAVAGVLAAFIALAAQSGPVAAQSDPCDGPLAPLLPQCGTGAGTPTPSPTMDPGTTPDPIDPMAGDTITSDSTTSSGAPEITVTIAELAKGYAVGTAIVLYLEDDFQEPDSIPTGSVYFVADMDPSTATGNGARVYPNIAPKVETGAYFDEDKKDIAIRVFIPDMCVDSAAAASGSGANPCAGPNGPEMGQRLRMIVEDTSGIKNPSEAGTHSVSYDIVEPGDAFPSASNVRGRNDARRAADPSTEMTVSTVAKITLSDVDNSRGYEMTVTGSGFNNGTSAAVYVLAVPGATETPSCQMIVDDGTKVGGAIVGSDDKVAVTFEVTAPTFKPGNVNYICMVDGEGRASSTDVEDFKLEPSIKVVPSSVATGDTVNVFAQDFPSGTGGFAELKIGGMVLWATGAESNKVSVSAGAIRPDGSDTATFKVPGGLEGVLRIDAKWGSVNEDSKITITGGELNPSKTDVMPNETITVSGNGFGTQTCIPFSNITLDNTPVMVHPDSNSDDCAGNAVKVSNSGQFVATVIVWPAPLPSGQPQPTNPTLIPGTHELEFEDTSGFSSSVSLTIDEPVITVAPDIAGPRDYITIMGENWPVDNLDNTLNQPITVCVEDFGSGERCNGRSYPVYADAVGRFTVEHRIHRRVAIPDTVQIKATYADVAKVGSFAVPASTVDVTPGEGQPGDMVTLSAGNMPVYTEVDYIEIGGTRYDDPGVNTDRDGNVTVDDVLIPGLDPGVYSVVVNVDDTIAIGEVTVLAESSAAGAPAMLPGAVENLGDSLVAIFHFDDVGKTWSFYDPRPEFSDLNTLTEMVNGEAYWILVSETVEDVVLNNKVRSLTCRGDDCWNLEVW